MATSQRGRDIGTVVESRRSAQGVPDGDEEGAAPRHTESRALFEDVVESQRERDLRDREREHSPLHPADDAVELDTTGKSVAEVVEQVVQLAREQAWYDPRLRSPPSQVAVVGFPNVGKSTLVNRLAGA